MCVDARQHTRDVDARLHLLFVDKRQHHEYVDARQHQAGSGLIGCDPSERLSMRFLTPKDIGALAREARLEAGMTQTELGLKIGASRFWVAEFERGKPRAELALALKALRALRLIVTVEAKEEALRRRGENRFQPRDQPFVDLSSLLRKSTTLHPVFRPEYSNPMPSAERESRHASAMNSERKEQRTKRTKRRAEK